jgi:HNH endonuclease
MIISPTTRPRFEAFAIKREDPDACWKWNGSRDSAGYGKIHVDRPGYPRKAHRVSWVLHFGPIPHGLDVCHSCDNPECTNPRHIFLGTHNDNMQDAKLKGRMRRLHGIPNNVGEANPRAKLTVAIVAKIKESLRSGMKQADVARAFSVRAAQISKIHLGERWRHVE